MYLERLPEYLAKSTLSGLLAIFECFNFLKLSIIAEMPKEELEKFDWRVA